VHTGLYVMMGVCGSGKSLIGATLARELDIEFVEGDALHPPANVKRMAAGIPLTDDDRHGWLIAIAARLREANRAGVGLVVSCSALKRSYRDLLRSAGDADISCRRHCSIASSPFWRSRRRTSTRGCAISARPRTP
jgi:gluconokinase